MSHYYCDYDQVRRVDVNILHTDGTGVDEEASVVPIVIPVSEVAELLQNYDPASGTSPSVTYSRPLSRAILDAIKRHEDERQP